MSTLPIAVPQDGLRARIREFFYTPEVPYGIASREKIVLPLVLLFAMVPRWYFARELFSDQQCADIALGILRRTSLASDAERSGRRRHQ